VREAAHESALTRANRRRLAIGRRAAYRPFAQWGSFATGWSGWERSSRLTVVWNIVLPMSMANETPRIPFIGTSQAPRTRAPSVSPNKKPWGLLCDPSDHHPFSYGMPPRRARRPNAAEADCRMMKSVIPAREMGREPARRAAFGSMGKGCLAVDTAWGVRGYLRAFLSLYVAPMAVKRGMDARRGVV